MKIFLLNTIKEKALFMLNKFLNLIFGFSIIVILWLIGKVFFWASFNIPTTSMEPTIISGDRVVVWKPWIGARLLNVFSLLKNRDVDVYRIPGVSEIKRNDIVVFNYPYVNGWSYIKMHMKKYYIKRCIGLPGDTITINEGWLHIANVKESIDNKFGQFQIVNEKEEQAKQQPRWATYPNHPSIDWNINKFGPLMIPQKDSEITMNHKNYILYHVLIEWETNKRLTFNELNNCCYIDQEPILNYRFTNNYFFMAGDNLEESEDSRYWGLVPEPFIVGKVGFVLNSHDPITGHFRWERFLKNIE